MRTAELATAQVSADKVETLGLLLLLLAFALLAAGYVFAEGLKEGKKSEYELLLKCVLILTSVVPPELPMQSALAVNTALMALIKARAHDFPQSRTSSHERSRTSSHNFARAGTSSLVLHTLQAGVYCTEPFRVPFAGKIDAVRPDQSIPLTSP